MVINAFMKTLEKIHKDTQKLSFYKKTELRRNKLQSRKKCLEKV